MITIAAAVMTAAIIIVYYNFNPGDSSWKLHCPSKFITGIDCPACGAQRALHACLHGDIGSAWHYNPFLFIGFPYLLLALWGNLTFLPGYCRACRIAHSKVMAYGYIIFFFAWWVIRNL